jgi:hypothetical protein
MAAHVPNSEKLPGNIEQHNRLVVNLDEQALAVRQV